MVFKISDKKVDKSVDLQEKGLSFPKSHTSFKSYRKSECVMFVEAVLCALFICAFLLVFFWGLFGPFSTQIEIIRNEMNESMKEFTIQTINNSVNSCLNNYECFSSKMMAAFNKRYPSTGDSKWQIIVTSRSRMFSDIDYLHGSYIECRLNGRRRIIVYRVAINTKVSCFSRCFHLDNKFAAFSY